MSIAEARALAENAAAEVTGVVTFIDGKNVVVQDDTAGIVLRFDSNPPADVAVGKQVTAIGKRGAFSGLEQLTGVTEYTVADGVLPEPVEKTIAEILADQATGALESTRVKVTGAVIGAINTGGNTTLTQGDDTINIYKVPELTGIAEGDTVNVIAVVGDHSGYQLRVAAAGDVTVETAAALADMTPVAEGTVAAGETLTFSLPREVEGVTWQVKLDDGEWTTLDSNTYTIPADLTPGEHTLLVRATTGSETSKELSLTCTGGAALTGTLTESVAHGDQVVVYYPKGKLAVTGTADGSKLTGVEATVDGQELTTTEAAAVFTVHVDSNGNLSFVSEDGKYLTSGETGSSLTLADAASDYSLWTLEDAEGGHYIKNVNAKYNDRPQYIEYHYGFTTYGFSSSKADIYTYQFYKTGHVDLPAPAVDYPTDKDVVESIAAWGGGGPYDDSHNNGIHGDKYTSGDMLDTNATFTAVVSGAEVKPFTVSTTSTGGTNYYMGGTGLGSGTDDYLQFAVSTAGWGDMTLSFRLRASNSGAGEWTLQYSTDGTQFENFTTGEYAYSYTNYSAEPPVSVEKSGKISDGIAKTSMNPTKYIDFTFDVPTGAENATNLYIRLVPGTTKAKGEGKPGTGGTVRIDSVVLSGSPIVDDGITSYVAVEPDGEEDQAAGTELTMTCATEGATIKYRFDGDTDWSTYDENAKPALPATLPAHLEVYAEAAGKAPSVTRIFTYAAGTVSAVKMAPNGGGVYIANEGDTATVTLSCDTEGATIYYNDDGSDEYKVYTDPIVLSKGFGARTIKAYATKTGFTDSAVTTRTFTERSKDTYDLYFGQMHSHTSYSDGAGTCDEAFRHASGLDAAWNIDFLAVTDHSNSFDNADAGSIADGSMSNEWVEGHNLADTYTKDGFVGIYGFEMTWSNGLGHINTFNTPGFQSRTQEQFQSYGTALQNYYAVLKTESNSISQFNHPGTTFGDFSDFAHYDEEIDNLITMIEVGNGEGAIGSSGYFPSYEYYTRALDKGWHVAPTNNQDNHKGNWGDSNTGRTVILADSLDRESVYDAIRNYRVYATEDLNLEIRYTLDGSVMGTILDGASGETVDIQVGLNDADDSDTARVEVIVNGGLVAESKNATCNETVSFAVPAKYSYYYIKVTQADGDIAVTAPVWIGKVEAVGITSLSAASDLTVVGEEQTLTLELFNNENKPLDVTSIVLTDKKTGEVLGTDTTITSVPKMGTASCEFKHTFTQDGIVTVTATVTGTLNGVEKTYTQDLELTVMPKEIVNKIIVDGTHYNDYVTGYYGGNMGNMTAIAAGNGVKVEVVTSEITADMLTDCSLLVISAPAKRTDTSNAGPYSPKPFEDEFIEMVKTYVEGGGSVVVCGLADYQDKKMNDPAGHTAAQLNKLLEAIGSTMRINDDEVIDAEKNGGQPFRLYPENFNADSKWTSGIVDGQTYSQYSGCSVNAGNGTWLVKGFESTWGADSDEDGVGILPDKSYSYEFEGTSYTYNAVTDKGDVVFLACEETAAGGTIFAAGGVFLSDFEVKAELDNIWDKPYANRTIYENILGNLCATDAVTPIGETRTADLNRIFVIEGYVTNGTTDENTSFFDAIYVQDETGGTTAFPYANPGLAIGTKVRIIGSTDAYQDDRELQIISLKVLEDAPKVYEPKKLSTQDAMDYDTYGGQLVSTTGVVSDIIEENGVVSQFKLTDSTGVAATIFIDGYITNPEGKNDLASWIENGQTVSAVGLLYKHPEKGSAVSVPVLRVRNCDEITRVGGQPVDPDVPDAPVVPIVPSKPAKPAVTDPVYIDVAERAWYYDAVMYVTEKGLMTGTGKAIFNPDGFMTRAMVWTVLGRMSGARVDGGTPWYSLAQAWAMADGVSDGTTPDGQITREQLATMLYRYVGSPKLRSGEMDALKDFADYGDVSDYARDAMAWAVSNGIINGMSGKLEPQGPAIRSQVAAMLMRFCKYLGK